MHRLRFLLLLLTVLFAGILLAKQSQQPEIRHLYQYAENLYKKENPTETDDSLALHTYQRLIVLLKENNSSDSILWDCYFKAAIYHQTYGNYDKALPLLLQCIGLRNKVQQVDGSSWYLPNLYTANSYYVLNRFDSARYYYKQAESVALQYHNIEGLERLYNAFGILSFETGNYSQSKINFEKAIGLLKSKKDPAISLMVNYQSNLASSLRKLRQYDESMNIYLRLLSYGINTDEINHNIASIYLAKDSGSAALVYLHKIRKESPGKYNDLGLSHFKERQYDSAAWYFHQSLLFNEKLNGTRKNIQAGLAYRYRGNLLAQQGKYTEALADYQSAIRQLIFSYNDSSVYSNPSDYTGTFAVIELYETLLAKASAFIEKYNHQKNIKDLQAALQCFRSLYQLTDFVEKTYESDEARIFLNQKKYLSHQLPIATCLRLYELTLQKTYLSDAFYFDERNKASVLSTGLSEKEIKVAGNIPADLMAKLNNTKETISYLSLKAASGTASADTDPAQDQLREQQLKLESLYKELNDYPAYIQWKFGARNVSIEELQQKIIPANTAILSYHLADSSLLCWLITRTRFEYIQTPINDSLLSHIRTLYINLQNVQRFSTSNNRLHTRYLYQLLIKPVVDKLSGYDQLMIIPDDELNYIPFEMLTDEQDNYLLGKFAISYNYSCGLLKEAQSPKEINQTYSLLALAPYSDTSRVLNTNTLASLPASASEIKKLNGKLLFGTEATKDSFIKLAPRYRILHLATHAQANDSTPIQSFIAFYPSQPDSLLHDRIYIPEIYNLNLSNTYLTFLSACETGSGQLIKGEGIISLSRAFSYAGCPNMITSQWKADDDATAYILRRVHYYLDKMIPISTSLQMAKLDYLNDTKIEGRLKTPAYWAHLRFTGQLEKKPGRSIYWIYILISVIFILYILKKIRPNKPPGRSRNS